MAASIHHSAIVVSDLESSLRFYRDGIGLEVLQDRSVEGEWPSLFGVASRHLRAVFLGDPSVADVSSGVLELNVFDEGGPVAPATTTPVAGLFLLSFFVDVEGVLGRLAQLGLGGEPRRVSQVTAGGSITIATVRDPDGVTILLTPGSITQDA
jgi:glyoxylase I family protein